MHLPRRLGTLSAPPPLIQLALDPDSPRGRRLGENHHLWRNGRLTERAGDPSIFDTRGLA